jgi:hypothetical protein
MCVYELESSLTITIDFSCCWIERQYSTNSTCRSYGASVIDKIYIKLSWTCSKRLSHRFSHEIIDNLCLLFVVKAIDDHVSFIIKTRLEKKKKDDDDDDESKRKANKMTADIHSTSFNGLFFFWQLPWINWVLAVAKRRSKYVMFRSSSSSSS